MTDDEIHSSLVKWIGARTKRVTIKTYQGGERPSNPYISVNFTRLRALWQWQQDEQWTELATVNSAAKNDLLLEPILEQEWEFSIQSYGSDASTPLRLLASLSRDAQLSYPLFSPTLHIHEVSQINTIPELINDRWENRAQCYLTLRGITTDGDIADSIEDIDDTVFAPV